MIYRGTWNISTSYAAGDLVLYDYKYYLASSSNTGSTPPTSPWQQFTFIQSLAYTIATSMGLSASRVWIYNQDYKIPPDKELFIVLEYRDSQPYAGNNRRVPTDAGAQENISVLTRETYTINVLSKDASARIRKEEVLMALTSTLAEQQQEIFQYKIGKVPKTFRNISELEGAGMLNRFAVDVSILAWHAKVRNIDYFDQFSDEIIND